MSQNPWGENNQQNSYGQNMSTSGEPQGNYPQQGYDYNGYSQTATPTLGHEQHAMYQEPPQSFEQAPEKKHTSKVLLTSALLAALVGGGVGAGVVAVGDHASSSSVATTNKGTTIVNNTDSVNAVTAAAEKATPSVVTIGVSSSSASGSGSGIVLDGEGHILTNTHVVTLDGETGNAKVEVQLSDGNVRTASIVGTDPTSDLAVIKLDDTSGLNLTPATIGDSSKLNVGDTTIAIGAPLGLQNTVTDGILSNQSRTIEIASSAAPEESDTSKDNLGSQDSPFQFEMPGQQQQSSSTSTISINVLQTDAAVNPGNSGGALVNSNGEVIGVNVAIASADNSGSSSSSGNIGVGFAIPINYAQRIAQDIIANGEASHGLLGASVSTSPANDDSSDTFGDGALIQEISNGGAADQAGLKTGDVITEFNGKAISEASELTAAVRETEPGSKVSVKYTRNGQEQSGEVQVGDSANN